MTNRSNPHDTGFTLVEVLVAISLLGLASVIILGALGDTRAREHDWQMRQMAARVGQNAIELWTHLRQSQGEEKGGFTWSIDLQPYPTSAQNPSAQAVEVRAVVRWKSGARAMLLSHHETRLIRGAP